MDFMKNQIYWLVSVYNVHIHYHSLTATRYVMLASVLGFYSLPGFRNLRPVPHGTPMVKVIGNCIVLLILSSALPVMSRTLGKAAVE